ncbi:hypothetical protein [Hydrogenivirga sp. 128-5-R1-1]|uniref:hypothetical protein n=1 Tax=Hydrogenivirga sp. 128-5-R1-1 TaxID=392423 RepID=UPI00015F252D|nr:hypothetical protein [Hydrogenivirga sp. 128-5-R1-1]EDP74141.1 hypothetical protein HG1285_06983 [Hydrogenivirga sp. 128-5-R1-1]
MKDKEKELEILKAKIEYLKMLTFILITIGTAFFTLIFWIYGKGENLLKLLLVFASLSFFSLLVNVILLDSRIKRRMKNLEDKNA